MTVHDLAEIRSAISAVIDDGDPQSMNRTWVFRDSDDPFQIDERTRFVDAVQAILVRRAKDYLSLPVKAAKEKDDD